MPIPTSQFAGDIADLAIQYQNGDITAAEFKAQYVAKNIEQVGDGVTNVALAANMADFLLATNTWGQQLVDWSQGTVDGGPNGDGLYPFTTIVPRNDGSFLTVMMPCLARIMDPFVGSEAVAVQAAADAQAALTEVLQNNTQAAASAAEALEHANDAEASRLAAEAAEALADAHKGAAKGFKDDAEAAAVAANASKLAAQAARLAADTAQIAAEASEIDAAASRDAAALAKIAAESARDAADAARIAAEAAKDDLEVARDTAAASASAAAAARDSAEAHKVAAEAAKTAAEAAKVAAELAEENAESAEALTTARAIAAETAQAAAEAAQAAAEAAQAAAEAARDQALTIAGFDPNDYVEKVLLGVADGVALLGPDGKILPSQLAAMGLQFRGTWNATTNTPAIPPADETNTGHVYIVDTDGSTDLDGETDWKVGDWAMSMAGAWYKLDQTNLVSSVNGMQGAVVVTKAHVGLGAVDNTADADKPVSTAQAAALALKLDKSAKATLTEGQVGADNTKFMTALTTKSAFDYHFGRYTRFRVDVTATGSPQTVALPHEISSLAELLIFENGVEQNAQDLTLDGFNLSFTRPAGANMSFVLPGGVMGQGLEPDARGTLADRDGFDSAADGFCYLDTDNAELYFKASSGWNGPFGLKGADGQKGADGIDGQDGADAVIDAASIEAALGYVPQEQLNNIVTANSSGVVALTALPTVSGQQLGYLGLPQSLSNISMVLGLHNMGKHVCHTSAGDVVWEVPAITTAAFPLGAAIVLYNAPNAGTLTVNPQTGVSIYPSEVTTPIGSGVLKVPQAGSITLLHFGANQWAALGGQV